MRVIRGVVALAVIAGLAGCTFGAPPKSDPSQSPSARPATLLPWDSGPPAFDRAAAVQLPDKGVTSVRASGDTVFTIAPKSIVARRLPSLQPAYELVTDASGGFRDVWVSGDTGYALATATRGGSGISVGADTFEIQKFDLDTGEVLSAKQVDQRKDPAAPNLPASGRIVGLQGNDVIVDSWLEVPMGSSYTSHTALAIDPDSGSKVWRQRPATVLGVAGKQVLVNTGTTTVPGWVMAIGRDGKKRWKALPLTSKASMIGTTSTTALVAHQGLLGVIEMIPLRLSTGKAGKPQPVTTPVYSCRDLAGDRAVCATDKRTLQGIDLAKNKIRWSLPDKGSYAPTVTAVYGNRVYGIIGYTQPVLLDGATGKAARNGPEVAVSSVTRYGGLVVRDGVALFFPGKEAGKPQAPASTAPAPEASQPATPQSPETSADPQEPVPSLPPR